MTPPILIYKGHVTLIKRSKSFFRTAAIIESFEMRRLLSSVIVNTLADETIANTTTSLREAIQIANPGDSINFAAGVVGTITLGGNELVIDKDVSIYGPGASKLAISANNASRVMRVDFMCGRALRVRYRGSTTSRYVARSFNPNRRPQSSPPPRLRVT